MFDKILFGLGLAAEVLKGMGGKIGTTSTFALGLVAIVQKINAIHKEATGEDIDPAKLHQIELIP